MARLVPPSVTLTLSPQAALTITAALAAALAPNRIRLGPTLDTSPIKDTIGRIELQLRQISTKPDPARKAPYPL
jgi:hypothetical protein